MRSGKRVYFGTQVWVSMPFLDLSERFAARKKSMHFGARVWISMPFLDGHAFWSKSVDFYALFGILRGGRGVLSNNDFFFEIKRFCHIVF